MKSISYFLLAFLVALMSCQPQVDINPENPTPCPAEFQDHVNHPRAAQYQEILDRNRQRGLVGATLMIKDQDGIWTGASGMADLKAQRTMQACDRMMIASISKPFTATVIFSLIDDGLLTLDSEAKQWFSDEVKQKVANMETVQVKHLLAHRSGIPDYYHLQNLLDQVNVADNEDQNPDFLEKIYGKKADFAVDESYAYSNTNFVLLGMIAEAVSGKSLKQLYQEVIFDPLSLTSAYFDTENPLPADMAKGYADFYGNGDVVESSFLFVDEARTPDGGIVINGLDVYKFFKGLFAGQLISEQSLQEMTTLFDLPDDWQDKDLLYQLKNGYGIEHFEPFDTHAFGHTGAVDGFLSIAMYFPEEDFAIVQITNTASYDYEPRIDMFQECGELMFE
jgi:D-alanyl-D-alanine carboxypeptidase